MYKRYTYVSQNRSSVKDLVGSGPCPVTQPSGGRRGMGGQEQDRQGQDDDEGDEDDEEKDNDMTDGDSEDRRWAGQGRRQAARTGNAFLRGNAGKMRWATNRQLGSTKNRPRGMKQRHSY